MEQVSELRPIKLLALLPSLQGGGSEQVMLTLLRHLDRRRFTATLAVVDGRSADLESELPADLECQVLGCARVRHAVPALWRLVRQRQPEVVLSTLGHLNMMLALMKPLLPRGTRLVGRESSIVSEAVRRERHTVAWRWAYRAFYRSLDLVICQSHAMQDDLCRNFGMPPARTVVIPNPLDLQRIARLANQSIPASPGRGTRVLAVGRLSPVKGFDVLIRAIAACPELPLTLDILGQGSEDAALRELISQLGLGARVRLHGFQPNPYAWMRQADLLVLSSSYEGLPNVVLEALACGTPVLTTPVPSALEIVNAIPQAVVADGFSADSLARALRSWHASARERVPAGTVDRYAVQAIARRYEDVLAHAAGV